MSLVLVEVADRVATVTLNNPDERNTLTAPMVDEIVDTFDALEADDGVGAVVVTGAPPAFCAGANLGNLGSSQGPGFRSIYEGFLRVGRCTLPTLAAVNGAAVGAGMNLALVCDVRVAARRARFDTRFLQIGIHPGGGHTWMLRRIAGPQVAAATVLFGEVLDGAEAERVGLVWRCVDDDQLLAVAHEMAKKAADAPRELRSRSRRRSPTWPPSRRTRRPSTGSWPPRSGRRSSRGSRSASPHCRPRSPRRPADMGAVRELADRFTEEMFSLDPNSATFVGAVGHDDRLTDNSPEGHEARAELVRRTLSELAGLSGNGSGGGTGDVLDARCARLLRERLEATLLIHDHGEHLRMVNNISSPVQELRDVFDVTPSTTPEEWEVLATRLEGVPVAYEQFRESLRAGVARGEYAALRHRAAISALDKPFPNKPSTSFSRSLSCEVIAVSGVVICWVTWAKSFPATPGSTGVFPAAASLMAAINLSRGVSFNR